MNKGKHRRLHSRFLILINCKIVLDDYLIKYILDTWLKQTYLIDKNMRDYQPLHDIRCEKQSEQFSQ